MPLARLNSPRAFLLAHRMAAEAMHEWGQFGPPQLWMCNQNAAIGNGVNPYSGIVDRMATLERDAIGAATETLGASWLADPDVRLLALALLLGEP